MLYSESEIALLRQQKIEADEAVKKVVREKGRKINARIVEARAAGGER